MSLRITIVGGGTVGRLLGLRLGRRGDSVRIVERDVTTAERVRESGIEVIVGDGTDTDVLDTAGIAEDDAFLAATGDDDVNLLATQLAASLFGVERVIARVNDVENRAAFEETGVEAVSTSEATAIHIDNYIERPALTDWIDELGVGGDAQEVQLSNETVDGWTISELDDHLPEQVVVVTINHEGVAQFPNSTDTVVLDDKITVLGTREAVDEARRILDSESTLVAESGDR